MKSESNQRTVGLMTEGERSLYILVVEDHPDTRRALEMFLQALGHELKLASDVKAALDLAAAGRRFDLLLSDLRLPDGNGWDLLRRLEESGRRPQQAIAISGWSSENDLAKSKGAGFRAHLIKPLAPETLIAALVEVTEAILSEERTEAVQDYTAEIDSSRRTDA
ncbi:MAG: response regulator [Verrucomicrobia bacterium]|nr:response regulator [Verrucomicrobiota bacterium]